MKNKNLNLILGIVATLLFIGSGAIGVEFAYFYYDSKPGGTLE